MATASIIAMTSATINMTEFRLMMNQTATAQAAIQKTVNDLHASYQECVVDFNNLRHTLTQIVGDPQNNLLVFTDLHMDEHDEMMAFYDEQRSRRRRLSAQEKRLFVGKKLDTFPVSEWFATSSDPSGKARNSIKFDGQTARIIPDHMQPVKKSEKDAKFRDFSMVNTGKTVENSWSRGVMGLSTKTIQCDGQSWAEYVETTPLPVLVLFNVVDTKSPTERVILVLFEVRGLSDEASAVWMNKIHSLFLSAHGGGEMSSDAKAVFKHVLSNIEFTKTQPPEMTQGDASEGQAIEQER